MDIVSQTVSLAAELASIIYIVTGTLVLLIARLRTSSRRPTDSSVAMLFCRRATRERIGQISLTR